MLSLRWTRRTSAGHFPRDARVQNKNYFPRNSVTTNVRQRFLVSYAYYISQLFDLFKYYQLILTTSFTTLYLKNLKNISVSLTINKLQLHLFSKNQSINYTLLKKNISRRNFRFYHSRKSFLKVPYPVFSWFLKDFGGILVAAGAGPIFNISGWAKLLLDQKTFHRPNQAIIKWGKVR